MGPKFIFLVIFLALLVFSACSKANEEKFNEKDMAPDFTLENLSGEQIVLSEVLKEKSAVLVFWATWCPYCRTEIPRMEEFYLKNKGKVELISIDVGESKQKVQSFMQNKKASYPVVLDSDSEVAKLYSVLGVPTTVAIDKTGQILYYGHSVQEMSETVEFK